MLLPIEFYENCGSIFVPYLLKLIYEYNACVHHQYTSLRLIFIRFNIHIFWKVSKNLKKVHCE
ncbi:hypothetical protein Avbf_07186 [Armadillidium vulgare]|nr:hypothetical protein Avbf_07186 [Armadillidium vulgare]